MIFQPMTLLNQSSRSAQISEVLQLHRGLAGTPRGRALSTCSRQSGSRMQRRGLMIILTNFRVASGGCVAIALACEPEILIADEPTTV